MLQLLYFSQTGTNNYGTQWLALLPNEHTIFNSSSDLTWAEMLTNFEVVLVHADGMGWNSVATRVLCLNVAIIL